MAEDQAGGAFETRADAGEGGQGAFKLWMMALDLASKEEENWRKRADEAVKRYRAEQTDDGPRPSEFNILYSNVQTQGPAIYNSTPKPDVRRRFNDEDPLGKVVSQVYERVLSHCIDEYDFDSDMEAVVYDSLLPGRGVSLVVYDPVMSEDEVTYETVRTEFVQWQDFRRGPGRRWDDVPWMAVRYRITREQAIELNPQAGATVSLDYVEKGSDKENKDVPDVFKRLTVWKIWDKPARQVKYLAPSYKEGLFAVSDDTLQLEGFFPTPRPLYDIEDTGSLVPMVPYELYKQQAVELDTVSRRIRLLTDCLRWRGIRPAQIREFDDLKDAKDGELVPSESAEAILMAMQAGGDLNKVIAFMPIERLIEVVRELVLQREAIKQVIFEITGLSDIQRGETDPNETLGAQQIKAQWGSLRMQRRQREMQRYVRDIFRIKAEIIGQHFSVQTLQMISGIQLPTAEQKMLAEQQGNADMASAPTWEDVKAVMANDALRSYRVDIETDSTIAADLTRAQENMARFVEGLAAFGQAVGPAVQAGVMPMDIVSDLLSGFARNFKLGRQAEDALDRLGKLSQQPQPPKPDPEAERMKMEMAQKQAEMQMAQADKQADLQFKQAESQQRLQFEAAKHEMDMAQKAEDMAFQRETRDMERQDRMEDLAFRRQESADKMAFEKRKFDGTEAGAAASQLDDMRNDITATAEALQQVAGSVQAVMAEVASLRDSLNSTREIRIERRNGRIVGGHITQGELQSEVVLQ